MSISVSSSGGIVGITGIANGTQAEAMTSNAVIITPSKLKTALQNASFYTPNATNFVLATLGTGGLNDGLWDMRRLQGVTSVAGGYVRMEVASRCSLGRSFNENIDWSKPQSFSFRMVGNISTVDSNSVFIATLGEANGTNIDDPTIKSIGVKLNGGGALILLAHDGTTLTSVTSSVTPTNNISIDIIVQSDGLGKAELLVNRNTVATIPLLAPKTLTAGFTYMNSFNCRIYNNSTPSGSQISIYTMGWAIQNGI